MKQPPPPPSRPGLGECFRQGPAVWLAAGLGAGLFPVVPGTIGSLWGLPLAWGVGQLVWWGQLLAIAGLFVAGALVCGRAAEKQGGAKDPGWIVFDEIASFPVVFFLAPLDAATLFLGFVLHRLFDITKLPPANRLERLPGGWGIMADDFAAAVYASLSLHGLLWLFAWLDSGS